MTGAAICALVLAGCAGAGGGNVPRGARAIGGEPAGGAAIDVTALGGYAGVGYLFTKDHQSEGGLKRTEDILEERVGAGVAGSVFSPNFLRYDLNGAYGLTQDWAEDGDDNEYDDGDLYEANANIDLFPTRNHPARAYFTRVEDEQPRVFFSKFESTTTIAGVSQDVRNEEGGIHFNVEQRKLEQEVFGSAFDDRPFVDVTENTAGVAGDYRLSEGQTISASYQFLDVDQGARDDEDFESHTTIGSHIYRFGEDRRHNMRSRVETVSQDGSINQQSVRWTEDFTARMTDSLTGDIGSLVERNDTDLAKVEQVRGYGGLSHQLWESLNSSLRVEGGRFETNDESTTDTVSGLLGLRYRKTTPWGIYRLSYTNFAERRFVESGEGAAVDESHTFPAVPPEEVTLARPFIDQGSIVITDPTGLIFFVEGIDYTLSVDAANFTVVTRLFAGTIPLGGTILVDYRFDNASDYTLDTMNQRVRTEHEFHNGLTPYFAFGYQDQHVFDVDGPGGVEPVRERSIIGGLEWRGGDFLLGAEYENRESTVLPFDAVRLRADATMRFEDIHHLTGGATQTFFYYDDPDRDVATSQLIARWRTNFARSSSVLFDATLRYDDDSIAGESSGFAVRAAFEHRWRQFRFLVEASHRETNGVTSDFTADEIGVRLVREFGAPPNATEASATRFLRE